MGGRKRKARREKKARKKISREKSENKPILLLSPLAYFFLFFLPCLTASHRRASFASRSKCARRRFLPFPLVQIAIFSLSLRYTEHTRRIYTYTHSRPFAPLRYPFSALHRSNARSRDVFFLCSCIGTCEHTHIHSTPCVPFDCRVRYPHHSIPPYRVLSCSCSQSIGLSLSLSFSQFHLRLYG